MPRRLLLLLTVTALVFGAGAVYLTWRDGSLPSLVPPVEQCQARVEGHLVELDVEQSRYAALIAAVSVQRGMPARAATIALATAYQESGLRNLEYGDRDSLGLFQQRPSHGWGSPEQILDPYHATNAFYDALAEGRRLHHDAGDPRRPRRCNARGSPTPTPTTSGTPGCSPRR